MNLPDPSFLLIQSLNGLTYAISLFLIASGLSLIFGVLGILNFAHGSLYMLGAYLTHQFVSLFVDAPGQFWWAVILGSLIVAAIGVAIERFFLRHLYIREELYQLLFTYALVLILSDLARIIWGTDQFSVSRPVVLKGAVEILGQYFPKYNIVIILLGPCIAFLFWFILLHTRWGRMIRAGRLFRDRSILLCPPHEQGFHCFSNRLCRSGCLRGDRCSDHRLFLRPPHQDLFRHADPRLFSDRLGDCLQVELPHGG